MTSDSSPNPMRIHFGNISPKLASSIDQFEKRLAKFGTLQSPVELHTKPIGDFHFAFVTMELTDDSFEKLKAAFHNVLYMGLKLTVARAKPNFDQRWAADSKRPDTSKTEREQRNRIALVRQKRIEESQTRYHVNSIDHSIVTRPSNAPNSSSVGYLKLHHTLNNISGNTKHTPPQVDLAGPRSYGSKTTSTGHTLQQYSRTSGCGEVVPGRHRKTARVDKKLQTLRININGELKQIKAFKTKLWGMDQNKAAKDLTWSYSNGVWKSGDDHVVERVTQTKDLEQAPEDLEMEKKKNSSLLESFLQGHDFDRPLELDEDVRVNKVEHYDYEAQGRIESESDEEDYANMKPEKQEEDEEEEEEEDKDQEFVEEEEEVEEDEFEQEDEQKETESMEVEEDEDEPIPTFGSNNTETLRTLFNPTESDSGFKVSLDEDDIEENTMMDEEQQKQLLEQIKAKQQQQLLEQEAKSSKMSKVGLFWAHFDSPFLQTQTQLSKVGADNVRLPGEEGLNVEGLTRANTMDENAYEQWFWEQRGELMRECRRRKRDIGRRKKVRPVI